MQNKGTTGAPTQSELEALIADRLNSGKQKMEVVDELVKSGMTHGESMQIVDQIYFELKKTAREEEFSNDVLLPALLGGLIAAGLSGAVWAAIAVWTGYEIGYVAWGVGLLCGLGVVMMSQGKRGLPLQIIAVVTSVLGIVIGKYGMFQHFFQESLVGMENGAALAAEYTLFSGKMMQVFAASLPSMAGGFDLLWVGLAVFTAWGIPKASGLKI